MNELFRGRSVTFSEGTPVLICADCEVEMVDGECPCCAGTVSLES